MSLSGLFKYLTWGCPVSCELVSYWKIYKKINRGFNKNFTMKQAKINIQGKVQGVFFREFVKKAARKLNLKGYVRNMRDDSVDVVAEGDEESLNQLIAECKKGPLMAHVKNVEVEFGKPEDEFDNFYVRP